MTLPARTALITGGGIVGKTLVISGFRNWVLAESLRISPRKLVTAVSRKLLDRAE